MTFLAAETVYDGRTYGPIGLRLKGSNSFQPFSAKPSLRINIDEYHENAKFLGLKNLTLNNMDDDFSMMHERLAYRVARAAGVPASRANHALLTVNGQLYGLYTNVETVKGAMLSRWFSDDTGPLYEATDVDFVASYIPSYELEHGTDDRTLMWGLAAALTNPSADAAIAAAASYVDLAAFQRFWAMAAVIAQFDSFPYSLPGDDYFVYANPATGRLVFLPWGMDETFYSGDHDVTGVNSVLARRCKESPACYQGFIDQVWQVQTVTESIDLAGERTRIAAQIRPFVEMDLRKPYPNEQVFASQQDLFWFITQRRQTLGVMLAPPSP